MLTEVLSALRHSCLAWMINKIQNLSMATTDKVGSVLASECTTKVRERGGEGSISRRWSSALKDGGRPLITCLMWRQIKLGLGLVSAFTLLCHCAVEFVMPLILLCGYVVLKLHSFLL